VTMIFTVDKRLFDLFPGLAVGVLVCHIDNFRYGDDRLESILDRIRSGFSYEKPQDHPHIRVWRQAFTKVGVPASKYLSSIESLLRRALKGGPFPRVNPIVDLYNAMSLEYLVPIGGHDLSPLDGGLFLGFAKGGEPFMPLEGGEPETAEKGEVVYKDDKDVLTRRWVWRQSNKDKVTPQTNSIVIPIDIMEGVDLSLCDQIMDKITAQFTQHGTGAVIHRDVVTATHETTEFRIG
jgi:DNA/RNA-binding domain of Phe-tRNA-synthetase-like protein